MVAFSTGPQLLEIGRKPGDSPGKPQPLTSPKPKRWNTSYMCSLLSDEAILAAPTLLDLVITRVTLIRP